jgi:hypothetical protein
VATEYGIMFYTDFSELHRGPYFTEAEVDQWLAEWREMGGNPVAFVKVSREVSEWKVSQHV